ncbi:MAG: C4-type zinc ribbon domain-containing protein [Opitutales bacterium]
MSNNIENLLLLQNIDMLIATLSQKLAKAQSNTNSAKENILIANKSLADFEASIKDNHARRAALKIEREALDEKVVKYKIQHATLKKNDEYQAMQLTIDRAKEEISKVEEVELEILFELDELESSLPTKKQEHTKRLAEIDAEIASLQSVADEVSAEIAKQKENRQAQLALVEGRFVEVYERLLGAKTRFPIVAQIQESKCSGCHLKLSVSLNQEAQSPDVSPVTCEHCGRILYV